MFASRKIRMFAFVGLVAVLFVGIAGTSANAGCYSYSVAYQPIQVVNYVPTPVMQYVSQPYQYPVIQYDCFGLPHTVWLTGFKTVPVTVYR